MTRGLQHVMLIDDDQLDNFAHERLMRKSGLVETITVFEYGQDALDFLTGSDVKVDLIFLDINMPRMTGFEFLDHYEKLAAEDKARAMVMMLSTSADPRDVARAEESPHVIAYHPKPLTEQKLVKIIDELLGPE